MRQTKRLMVLALVLALGGVAQADTVYNWDGGGGDGKWSTNANWNPDGPLVPVPGPTGQVDMVIDGNYSTIADLDLDRTTADDITIRNGAGNTHTITGTLETTGNLRFYDDSTLTIKDGGLMATIGQTEQAHFYNGFDIIIENGAKLWASDNQAHFGVHSGATITLEDGATLDSGTNGFLGVDGAGSKVTMNGANSWIRNGGEGGRTNVKDGGMLIVNDGKMDIYRYSHLKVATDGLIEFNGGQLNTRDLMVGATNEGAASTVGTMRVTGDADLNLTGVISVGNTDVSKGAGLLEITGGNATIDCATYTQNATGTLSLLIDPSGISAINATGAATLGGLLDVDFLGAATPGTWTVLSAGSIADNGIAFDPSVDSDLSDGVGWSMAIGSTDLSLTYAAGAPTGEIPEPATMLLCGLAAAGLGGYVRRRRRA